jgi:hypothetical protein
MAELRKRTALRKELIAYAQDHLGPAAARFQAHAEAYIVDHGEGAYAVLAEVQRFPALGRQLSQ